VIYVRESLKWLLLWRARPIPFIIHQPGKTIICPHPGVEEVTTPSSAVVSTKLEREPEAPSGNKESGGILPAPNNLTPPYIDWYRADKLEEPCSNCGLVLPAGALSSCGGRRGTLGNPRLSDLQSNNMLQPVRYLVQQLCKKKS
jgi:hypothetical protein